MDFINTWQFNLVAFLVSIIIYFQFNKLAVRQAKDDAAATIILQSAATLSILLAVPFFPITLPMQLTFYGMIIVASIFYALNDRLQTPIRKNLQVSVYSIINQLTFVFLFIYGLVIFQEPFDIAKVLGILLIVGANIALFYKKGELRLNKYVAMAVIASFAAASAIMIDVGASKAFNLPMYIALTLIIPGIFIMLAEKVSIKRVKAEYNSSQIKPYIFAGIAWAATMFFSLRALQLGELTTVVPLQSLSVILNVIVAYIFLKERQDVVKKVILAALVMVGILLTV